MEAPREGLTTKRLRPSQPLTVTDRQLPPDPRQAEVRQKDSGWETKSLRQVRSPPPASHFFSPLLCDNKRAPSPLAAALHLWALPKSRDPRVSEQLSYHKGSGASKKKKKK